MRDIRCVVVDFGMGNLKAFTHKLRGMGVEGRLAATPGEVEEAGILILPGVGHFAKAMANLRDQGLLPVLRRKVLEERTPILGICVGMQLFSKRSEEGDAEGLGWIDAETRRFRFETDAPYRVPHIGWSTLTPTRESELLEGIASDQRFYFIHSYHVVCRDAADVLTTTRYGHDFVSTVERDHIVGTQFHPEKSHTEGLRIVRNFLARHGRAEARS